MSSLPHPLSDSPSFPPFPHYPQHTNIAFHLSFFFCGIPLRELQRHLSRRLGTSFTVMLLQLMKCQSVDLFFNLLTCSLLAIPPSPPPPPVLCLHHLPPGSLFTVMRRQSHSSLHHLFFVHHSLSSVYGTLLMLSYPLVKNSRWKTIVPPLDFVFPSLRFKCPHLHRLLVHSAARSNLLKAGLSFQGMSLFRNR